VSATNVASVTAWMNVVTSAMGDPVAVSVPSESLVASATHVPSRVIAARPARTSAHESTSSIIRTVCIRASTRNDAGRSTRVMRLGQR
jgi:hypothetical protein